MKVAALLGLLAALPAHAGDAVTPAQARASVVQALPPDIAKGVGNGDLRAYLERLPQDQKAAAIRSLAAKEGELGDDPTTLGVIGQAYAGLGKVREAKQAAQAILNQNPDNPEARRIMAWVVSQEKLPGRDAGGGAFNNTAGPGGGGAGGAQANLNAIERRIQGVFRRGNNSEEFRSTLADAKGFSVAELNQAGISFKKADPGQKDAVVITPLPEGKFSISIREDALSTAGDSEARGAANVADGVRQAQTKRDHPYIGDALIMVRGWMTGAKVHKELAPNDIDKVPVSQPDKDLMVARKTLDQKTVKFDPNTENYGDGTLNGVMNANNSMINMYGSEVILERLLRQFGRTK
ncbi:hypothetical protein EPO15_03950 [bacterium]|nr:MAG: hypothetical protein EPO15_03950 [bacterium]